MSRLMRLLHGDRQDPREALKELFDTSDSGSAQPAAVAWASEVLGDNEVDPSRSPVEAIAVLRRAEPRLALKPARYLVETVVRS